MAELTACIQSFEMFEINSKAFGYEASSKYCKIAVVPDVQNSLQFLQFGFEVFFFFSFCFSS